GWLSACVAYIARRHGSESAAMAGLGAAVSSAIVLMKVVPAVPGSFTAAEWTAFVAWSAVGLAFWLSRRRRTRAYDRWVLGVRGGGGGPHRAPPARLWADRSHPVVPA